MGTCQQQIFVVSVYSSFDHSVRRLVKADNYIDAITKYVHHFRQPGKMLANVTSEAMRGEVLVFSCAGDFDECDMFVEDMTTARYEPLSLFLAPYEVADHSEDEEMDEPE